MFSRGFRQAFSPFLRGDVRTYGTVLLTGLVKAYGMEALHWESETLELHLKEDFEVHLPKRESDQLQAAKSVLHSDLVYHNVPAFDSVVNALAGEDPQSTDDIPSVLELAWAMREIYLLDPQPVGRDKQPFDADIIAYCQVVMKDEGMKVPPQALAFIPNEGLGQAAGANTLDMEAGFASQKARADEVDQVIEAETGRLFEQLQALGLDPSKLDL